MKLKQIFPGVYKSKNKLFTKSFFNESIYGEKVLNINSNYYREWVPSRSKLAAAILNGLKFSPFKKDSLILYFGAATGTTISHISDIVENGMIYGVEFSPVVGMQFFYLAKRRRNITPIIEDASFPENYKHIVPAVDIIYEDVAQRHQVEILLRNSVNFLRKNGIAIISIKSRSIDVAEKPKIVFDRVRKQLERNFEILQEINLEPWEKDHKMFVLSYI